MTSLATPLLAMSDVSVQFADKEGAAVFAVHNASLDMRPGEILGIAGESGSGKTQLLMAIMGLSPRGARLSGNLVFKGEELLHAPRQRLRELRGNRIAFVFQDPMTALNPYLTIGRQMTEVLEYHGGANRSAAIARSLAMLEAVGISDPRLRLRQYPHELSGGMRQRVMIGMALLCEPDLLLADEPTTALDVTVQSQVLDLLLDLRARLGTAILLVTHDLGVLARVADRVAVMQAGNIVEQAEVTALFATPQHPYTHMLLASARRLATGTA
ncbi:MAG: ABC transporter ATP-binding protein [Pseudomonadota bacterium]